MCTCIAFGRVVALKRRRKLNKVIRDVLDVALRTHGSKAAEWMRIRTLSNHALASGPVAFFLRSSTRACDRTLFDVILSVAHTQCTHHRRGTSGQHLLTTPPLNKNSTEKWSQATGAPKLNATHGPSAMHVNQ